MTSWKSVFRLRSLDVRIVGSLLFIIALIQLFCLGLQYHGLSLYLPIESYVTSAKNSLTGSGDNNVASSGTPPMIADDSSSSLIANSTFDSAGNATLGFQEIQYINLRGNFDREDALRMQSVAAGIKTNRFSDAVSVDDILDNGKGLPPTSDKELKTGEKACMRSHAELWNHMIQNNVSTMLILEADAAWDANVRQIHKRIAKGFYDLHANTSATQPTEDDPYNSQSWDIISFGTCHDSDLFHEDFLLIDDPDAPLDQKYYDMPLDDKRVVRRAGYVVCTTAYAVSLAGARKLLLRSAIDMNKPIDIAMGNMIEKREIYALSVFPPTIAQWQYVKGIGAENLGSTIQDVKSEVDEEKAKEVWSDIYKTKNIWGYKSSFRMARFRTPAFQRFKEMAYGNDDKK